MYYTSFIRVVPLADALEITLRAERRLGQLLAESPKAIGGDAQRTRFNKSTESPPTLAEMGIDKKLSVHKTKPRHKDGALVTPIALIPSLDYSRSMQSNLMFLWKADVQGVLGL